jgi:hypothetical protein
MDALRPPPPPPPPMLPMLDERECRGDPGIGDAYGDAIYLIEQPMRGSHDTLANKQKSDLGLPLPRHLRVQLQYHGFCALLMRQCATPPSTTKGSRQQTKHYWQSHAKGAHNDVIE